MTPPPSSPSGNCFSLHPQYTSAMGNPDFFLECFGSQNALIHILCLGNSFWPLKVHTFCEIFPDSPRQSQVLFPGRLEFYEPDSAVFPCVESTCVAHVCAHQPQGQNCAYDSTSCVPWVRKLPWRGKWQTTPVFLPGESHGQRSLVGNSPGGQRDGRDWVTFTFTFMCVQEILVKWMDN